MFGIPRILVLEEGWTFQNGGTQVLPTDLKKIQTIFIG